MQDHTLYSDLATPDEEEVYVVTSGASFRPDEVSIDRAIGELLFTMRELLDLDVVFIGEIVDGQRVFRQFDTTLHSCTIEVGRSDPMHDTICQRILDGRLPTVIPSVRAVARAQGLPAKFDALGTHIGVPVCLPNGRLYGMLCGFNIGGGACVLTTRHVRRLEMAALSAAHLIARAEGTDSRQADPALV